MKMTRLPPDLRASLLEERRRDREAARVFVRVCAEGDAGSHMRLNFSNATPQKIREGIRRLSIAVAHEIEHCTGSETAAAVREKR